MAAPNQTHFSVIFSGISEIRLIKTFTPKQVTFSSTTALSALYLILMTVKFIQRPVSDL